MGPSIFQAMAPIEIYGMQLSAPCRMVEMTAEMLGLEYEFKIVDLMAGEHMKPEYLALNPQHNIPCVKDGEFVGNESRAVAAYLAAKYGKDEADKLTEVLGWVDGFVAGDKFCAGTSQITIADIAFLATYSTLKAAGNVGGVDLSSYSNIESWFDKCVKLVPNYEKANGEGATAFGGFYKSKC